MGQGAGWWISIVAEEGLAGHTQSLACPTPSTSNNGLSLVFSAVSHIPGSCSRKSLIGVKNFTSAFVSSKLRGSMSFVHQCFC